MFHCDVTHVALLAKPTATATVSRTRLSNFSPNTTGYDLALFDSYYSI